MIHRIGDTYIRLDKIVAIKLNHTLVDEPTNIVKLILLDNVEIMEIEFKDYTEAKSEVDELVARLEKFYISSNNQSKK